MDLSSAFDTTNHKALLSKLLIVGVDGPLYNILSDFLSSRRRRDATDGYLGRFTLVRSAVPQGSLCSW